MGIFEIFIQKGYFRPKWILCPTIPYLPFLCRISVHWLRALRVVTFLWLVQYDPCLVDFGKFLQKSKSFRCRRSLTFFQSSYFLVKIPERVGKRYINLSYFPLATPGYAYLPHYLLLHNYGKRILWGVFHYHFPHLDHTPPNSSLITLYLFTFNYHSSFQIDTITLISRAIIWMNI